MDRSSKYSNQAMLNAWQGIEDSKGMTETQAIKEFKKLFCNPLDRFQRVESAIGVGIYDVNCCCDGSEFWIEFKSTEEPKRKSTGLLTSKHGLSQAQVNWSLNQEQAGGSSLVAIRTDVRWIVLKSTDLNLKHINLLPVDVLIQRSYFTCEHDLANKSELFSEFRKDYIEEVRSRYAKL